MPTTTSAAITPIPVLCRLISLTMNSALETAGAVLTPLPAADG